MVNSDKQEWSRIVQHPEWTLPLHKILVLFHAPEKATSTRKDSEIRTLLDIITNHFVIFSFGNHNMVVWEI